MVYRYSNPKRYQLKCSEQFDYQDIVCVFLNLYNILFLILDLPLVCKYL